MKVVQEHFNFKTFIKMHPRMSFRFHELFKYHNILYECMKSKQYNNINQNNKQTCYPAVIYM